jgi:hypothetical protein
MEMPIVCMCKPCVDAWNEAQLTEALAQLREEANEAASKVRRRNKADELVLVED